MRKRANLYLFLSLLIALGAGVAFFAVRRKPPEEFIPPNSILHLSDANFDKKLAAASTPVLVDFWAPWCGPCRLLSPLVAEVAQEREGRVTVMKLNVDEAQAIASRYEIYSIPTLILFKGGKEVKRLQGLVPKEAILQLIEG